MSFYMKTTSSKSPVNEKESEKGELSTAPFKSVHDRITSGSNVSYWINSVQPIFTQKLSANITADVVVVGGGIAGVTTAYCIAKTGKKVVLVEDGSIGSGETGRTTAHLVTALDDRYYSLMEKFGERKTRLIADSQRAAIDFIEQTVRDENISCDFERLPGYLFLHATDDKSSLLRELQAASEAVLDVTEVAHVPGMKSYQGACLRFDNQGQFHPMKYLAGLCHAFMKMGGFVFTETHAEKINSDGIVTLDGYSVKAKHVVVATNSPVNNRFMLHLRQYPYRTYVIGMKVKKGLIPKALWWDTGDHSVNASIPPYHYVRTQSFDSEYDLLICGGEDHPVGLPEEGTSEPSRYNVLEHWARERFPVEEVVYRWSGQVMEPMDSVAFIGRNPVDKDNVYVITGDSGNGMTYGTFAALLITDLVNGKKNKWEKIFSPSRFKLIKAGGVFFSEVIGGIINYLKSREHGDKDDIRTMHGDSGKVIKLDGKQYGVYRDEQDGLHLVNAECSHLQCIVKWNADEKSWDCPCHGSRYTREGRVINGPANADLAYHRLNIRDIDKEKLVPVGHNEKNAS
jgi:glycine/D-amino acid oxidase-like deaminating enzyme/Rieske Fe-S protein